MEIESKEQDADYFRFPPYGHCKLINLEENALPDPSNVDTQLQSSDTPQCLRIAKSETFKAEIFETAGDLEASCFKITPPCS